MNKHCYRLIFSKILGFLIPVAETTNAACKPGQTRGASTSTLPPVGWLLKALPLALLGVMPYTQAQIVVPPGQSGQMSRSAGGVPVMDINNPNSKGLSHNRLSEFNVANPGLIFNNSMRDGNSQIGGHVIHNPNLTREARAILTEVTGNRSSSIEGTLEVFGGRADIFIAKADLKKKKVDAPTAKHVENDLTIDIPSAPHVNIDKTITIETIRQVDNDKTITIETVRQVDDDLTIKGPTTTDVAVTKPGPGKSTDTNARHMTAATTGTQLKNALAKLNSPNSGDQAALKSNPVAVTIRDADGKLTTHQIKDANSLKALHGQQVVTGERAEYVNPGSGLGQSSTLYIKVVPQPGGGFTTAFTPTPPKPL